MSNHLVPSRVNQACNNVANDDVANNVRYVNNTSYVCRLYELCKSYEYFLKNLLKHLFFVLKDVEFFC